MMDQAARLIMVVDDDLEIRRMLGQILVMDGYAVVEACNGAVAVALLGAGAQPTLILLDLVMPQMDGRAFLKWRAQEPVHCQIPVLLVTGHQLDEEELRELGVCGALSKMLDAEVLLDEIQRHIDGGVTFSLTATECQCAARVSRRIEQG